MYKLNSRNLVIASLILSATLSVLVLGARNLFDDEILSFYLVKSPIRYILAVSAEGDVHPPGMYLLAHFGYLALPSVRWMNLLPLGVFYAGLAVFLVQVAPRIPQMRSQICLLLLTTLHPQLLTWCTTFRWYSWWTGFALIALTVALQPRRDQPTLSASRAAATGLLLGGMFYLNYTTLLFAAALATAMFLRYRAARRRVLAIRAATIVGIFFASIAPQIHTMVAVHLPNAGAQRASIAVSTLRLVQALAMSEAFLPWHPLAVLTAIVFAGLGVTGVVALRHGTSLLREQARHRVAASAIAAITAFGVLFFFSVALSGLGGKPRSALLLIPVLAPAAALALRTLRPPLQTGVLIVLALWSGVGISHLLGRYGLTKSGMNDRPGQVVRFVKQSMSAEFGPSCSIVVTYDVGLSFRLAQAYLPGVAVISPYRGSAFEGRPLPQECAHPRLFVVRSYVGGGERPIRVYDGELAIAKGYITGRPEIHSFSFDPDAAMKRRLALLPGFGAGLDSLATLPDYRYVVASGSMDRARVAEMYRRIPIFLSAQEAEEGER